MLLVFVHKKAHRSLSEWCAFSEVITGKARIGILLLISLYYNWHEGTTAYYARQYSLSMILERHEKVLRTPAYGKEAKARLVSSTHF